MPLRTCLPSCRRAPLAHVNLVTPIDVVAGSYSVLAMLSLIRCAGRQSMGKHQSLLFNHDISSSAQFKVESPSAHYAYAACSGSNY